MGLAMTAAAFSGCAMGRIGPGPAKDAYALDGSGADKVQARRAAVSQFFEAYLSTAARAGNADLLERDVLAAATSYVLRDQVVSEKVGGGTQTVKLRCLVDYQRLGKDLEAAGLVKPQGVAGRPRAALWIPDARRASQAVQAALAEKGFDAFVLEAADEPAAVVAANARGAAVLVAGRARVESRRDAALADLHPADAEAALKVVSLPDGEVLDDVSVRASAVDLDAEAAGDKALENAGVLAADKLDRSLAARFTERDEMRVLILGLGKLPDVERLLSRLRGAPGVAGAALSSLSGGDARLRVFVERLSADELAAALLRLPGFNLSVRAVEGDFRAIELELGGGGAF